jgi:uncharacterized protein DUF1937
MKLAYLASPYSDPDRPTQVYRFEEAAKATVWLFNHGWYVFSPIVQGHILDMYGQVEGYAAVRLYTHEMISRCDYHIVLCLPGWSASGGVTDGMKVAEALHKPTMYLMKEGRSYRLSSVPY